MEAWVGDHLRWTSMLLLRAALHLILLTALAPAPASAATVWTGPDLSVAQAAGAGGTVTDVLVAGVASLGRGSIGPFCNTEGGDICARIPGPADFEFAFSGLNGNGDFAYGSAADFASFTFSSSFSVATDASPAGNFSNGGFGAGVDPVAGVGHIVSLDIYFDIEIQFWGSARGIFPDPGGFAYRRSTVPEPGTAALLLLGLAGLAGVRSRR